MAGSRLGLDPAALGAAARGLDFKIRPTGIYRLARRDPRRSLIELVEVAGLEEYCVRLGIPPPPAHVTLFTEPGGRGIALYTGAELAACSEPAAPALARSPWRLDGDGAILEA